MTDEEIPDSTRDCVEIIENMGEWFVRVVRAGKAQLCTFDVEGYARLFAAGQLVGLPYDPGRTRNRTIPRMRRPGNPDPQSSDHPYEVTDFADKHGLTDKSAEVILCTNGPSRVACDAAARAFVAAVGGRMKRSDQAVCGRCEKKTA